MMRKSKHFSKIFAVIMGIFMLFSVACGGKGGGHTHVFDQKVESEKYFKSEKTCAEAKQYFYSCTCGEKGEEFFSVGGKSLHSYTAEVPEEKYVKTPANCMQQAEYYKSCSVCGAKSSLLTFVGGELGDHDCSKEVPNGKFLATEATTEAPAVYYKSCICGLVGTETFKYGAPLRELTPEEKEDYKAVSLTMTIYDPSTMTYGFTYNTQKSPLRGVVQIEKGSELTDQAQDVPVTSEKWSSYDADDNSISYYVSKAEVQLEPSTTYTYRVYDKYADVASEAVTFQTKDTQATSFSFSHVSDTQSVPASGANFNHVLANINTDFLLHTGDIVEYSKYEYEWTAMLDGNFEYLSKIPFFALPGNHDTTYKAGSSELTKHFHQMIPKQSSTRTGYYYSFTYGNAKFIMLNTNNNASGALDAEQYAWLIDELESSEDVWTIVAMHAPLYSVGQWGADPAKNEQSVALRKQLQSVFAEYGVDLVLQGHDHLLSCTNPLDKDGHSTATQTNTIDGVEYMVDPSGVIYVMNGTVGTNTKRVITAADGIYKYAQNCASKTWADIQIDGNTLTLEAKYFNGQDVITYQKWGVQKTA